MLTKVKVISIWLKSQVPVGTEEKWERIPENRN